MFIRQAHATSVLQIIVADQQLINFAVNSQLDDPSKGPSDSQLQFSTMTRYCLLTSIRSAPVAGTGSSYHDLPHTMYNVYAVHRVNFLCRFFPTLGQPELGSGVPSLGNTILCSHDSVICITALRRTDYEPTIPSQSRIRILGVHQLNMFSSSQVLISIYLNTLRPSGHTFQPTSAYLVIHH